MAQPPLARKVVLNLSANDVKAALTERGLSTEGAWTVRHNVKSFDPLFGPAACRMPAGLCAGVRGCAWVCAGVRGRARACAGVRGRARVYAGVRGRARHVCWGMRPPMTHARTHC